jgi:hypothetical protein
MKIKEIWNINRTMDFSDIEKIDIHLEIQKDGSALAMKDATHTFTCKPHSSFKFLFKRYPLMIIPALILSLAFLWIHPIAFFLYVILTIAIFTIAVRRCNVSSMGTYIMIFWILHLFGNFFILGGGSLSSFSMAILDKHYYIQSLFFGMLLTHIWLYVLIFLQQYYYVFNVIEEEDGESISTAWYIWKSCLLCNHNYNPFKNNCKEL